MNSFTEPHRSKEKLLERDKSHIKSSSVSSELIQVPIEDGMGDVTMPLNLVCGSYDDDDDDDDDHEEEFYWTEIEVNVTTTVEPPSESVSPPNLNPSRPRIIPPSGRPIQTPAPQVTTSTSSSPLSNMQFFSPSKSVHVGNSSPLTLVSSPPTLSHMDMARPPHEDPDYKRHFSSTILSSSWPRTPSYLSGSHRGGKVRSVGSSKAGSGRGKRNGESRKCRKVYGMEQKDQWCTQCKWKKACSRFGE
ncbi:Zinc finger protein [Armadillidium vulgare]|nr:Zinc finger protein [Armadillidium vulgare]